MKWCRLSVLAFALCFSAILAADSGYMLLQLSSTVGERPATHISLRLTSSGVDGPPGMGTALPLFSSGHTRNSMQNSEDQRPFCERSPGGCLAFGLLLGAGIAYFVIEAANDADGDTRVSFTSGSTGLTVNSAR